MIKLQLVPDQGAMTQFHTDYTKLTTEQLVNKCNELEHKAQVYSECDWEAYNRVSAELRNLDMILLVRYDKENETFLQNHPIDIA
jgi:RPA family protein